MALRSLAVAALALLCFANVSYAEQPQNASAGDIQSVLPLEDLRVFTQAYEQIRTSYIDEIDDRVLLEYAIRGMLEELDPHSSYLDASSFGDLQMHTTGEFGGLGIEVGMEDGLVKVISPIDDTPAQRAGIAAGDLIIRINDTAIKGLTISDAVEKMRGPKGSKIVLTIIRDGIDQPFELTLIRDVIKVRSVRTELLDEYFAYVRVAQFQLNTGHDLRTAVKKLQKEAELKGLILDLRNNPGGVLPASVEVADAFLDSGLVVYTEGRMPHSNLEFEAEPGDLTDGLPIVVLINEGSASASEIVAGALQDHRRAVVMGTASFGKGSVQTVIPITEDKALKLTTALYYTPNGRSIQAQGIKPDIVVKRAQFTAIPTQAHLTEAQLSGHLDNRQAPDSPEASPQESAEENEDELASRDNQLFEALNLLKGLNIFQEAQKAKQVRSEPAL